MALSISVGFHKNSLIVTCFTFGKFKIRTLTPSRFKNQSNNTFKLLGDNFSHQQGFLKQKAFTLHRSDFSLKFHIVLKKIILFCSLFWIDILNEILVTQNQNNIESNDYVPIMKVLFHTGFIISHSPPCGLLV